MTTSLSSLQVLQSLLNLTFVCLWRVPQPQPASVIWHEGVHAQNHGQAALLQLVRRLPDQQNTVDQTNSQSPEGAALHARIPTALKCLYWFPHGARECPAYRDVKHLYVRTGCSTAARALPAIPKNTCNQTRRHSPEGPMLACLHPNCICAQQ